MPNSREKQIVQEGYRNAVVSLSGILTDSNESWIRAIELKDFLNNDGKFGLLAGLRVDEVVYAVTDPMSVVLAWDGNTPQLIGAYSQSDEACYQEYGGRLPDKLRSGYNGAINLSTVGFVPGYTRTYAVTLKLVKLYTQ